MNVIEAAKVNVHAALLKLSSGQLPFPGLLNERRWCTQVAWLGTANLWEMGDPALMTLCDRVGAQTNFRQQHARLLAFGRCGQPDY